MANTKQVVKDFRYTEEIRVFAKDLYKNIISENNNNVPYGIWSSLSNQVRKEFPKLNQLRELSLRSWIRSVCLNDQKSKKECFKRYKSFEYTDLMRMYIFNEFQKLVPDKNIKLPRGIWKTLREQISNEFPELLAVEDHSLRIWIRNVCINEKTSLSDQSNIKRNEKFVREYPQKLYERYGGKIIMVNPAELKDALTKIDHRCLVHNVTEPCSPSSFIYAADGRKSGNNHGLSCCGYEHNKVSETVLNERAKLCGIKWKSKYINGQTQRNCECLTCSFNFSIQPDALTEKIRRGGHLTEAGPCPRCISLVKYGDGITTLKSNPEYANQYCELYVFYDLSREWWKIGISNNSDERGRRASTGKQPSTFYSLKIQSKSGTRAECWATEQVALALSIKSEPLDDEKKGWVNKIGVTELRRSSDWDYNSQIFTNWLYKLLDTSKSLGWIEFLLRYHPNLDEFSFRELKLIKNS